MAHSTNETSSVIRKVIAGGGVLLLGGLAATGCGNVLNANNGARTSRPEISSGRLKATPNQIERLDTASRLGIVGSSGLYLMSVNNKNDGMILRASTDQPGTQFEPIRLDTDLSANAHNTETFDLKPSETVTGSRVTMAYQVVGSELVTATFKNSAKLFSGGVATLPELNTFFSSRSTELTFADSAKTVGNMECDFTVTVDNDSIKYRAIDGCSAVSDAYPKSANALIGNLTFDDSPISITS